MTDPKDAALKYFIDNECTLEFAAEQYGMSTQTLWIHREAVLERACARLREALDLKDLSEDAPRAREKIRTLERELAVLQDVRADLADQDAKNKRLERELAEALREKQRLENAVNEAVCDYNGRVAAHTRELAAEREAKDYWFERHETLRAAIVAAVLKLTSIGDVMPNSRAGRAISHLRAAQKAGG